MVAVSRRWVVASFGLTLTLGAAAGAGYLLSGALGHVLPLDHRQLHGHTQVFGFVSLLAIGLVEATLPSALGLAPRRMARTAFWLLLAAILLRNLSQPFAAFPLARLGVLLSAALLIAGCLPVFVFVGWLLGEARPREGGGVLTLASGVTACYLGLAVGVNALQALWIAHGNGSALPRSLSEAFSDAALSGALLAAGFTLGLRLAPSVGRPRVRRGLVTWAVAFQAGGVGLALLSWLPSVPPSAFLALRDTGQLLVAAAVLLFLRATGLASGKGTNPVTDRSLRSSDSAIRLAFASLGLWALLTTATVALARFTSLAARNPWWEDAARHLFTVGFVTLLVVGAAGRLAPLLLGRTLVSGGMQRAAVALVASGAALRLLQYPALAWPGLYLAASVMGIPVVLGGLTPAEVAAALELEPAAVQVIPCDALGSLYAQTLTAMFPGEPLIATGKLERFQCEMWLEAGALAVCPVGAFGADDITEADLSGLRHRCQGYRLD